MDANTGRANAPGWAERLTQRVTRWESSVYGFVLAGLVVVGWTVAGLVYGFSDTWLLIINTAGTVTTLLMVFLIQRAQNKDTLALQLKLNEIVAALEGASNRLIDIESLSEEEVRRLHARYQGLANKALRGHAVRAAHSVEDHHEPAEPGERGHAS